MRADEIASRSSRHLARYSRLAAASLAFPFTSGRGGNNCFRRIVQRDRFSYRRFSLRVRRRRRALCGLLVANVRWTLYEMYLNAHPWSHRGHPAFSHFAHRDCYTPRKYRSALRENFLRCLIIFRPKTFRGLRPVYYHPLRLRGFPLYVVGARKTGSGYKIRENCK